MSEGLRRTLQALAGTPGFQVWVIRGDTDDGLRINRFFFVPPHGSAMLLGQGVDEFINAYRLWYEWADGQF
jgi:hypothetical protein